MAIPKPEAGLVIKYNYLWQVDAAKARENAKARPACIIVALPRNENETQKVVLVPITHLEPPKDTPALELPPKVKAHLGLDGDRSWVILNEINIDVWPSPDLAPIGETGKYAYGFLPPAFFTQIKTLLAKTIAEAKLARVERK